MSSPTTKGPRTATKRPRKVGASKLTTYRVSSARTPGRHCGGSIRWPLPAAAPFGLQVAAAVYIVEDANGQCCYVGSVPAGSGRDGLAHRLAEHLADAAKRSRWHTVWVLPLMSDTSELEVRRIEGVVGAHLGPYLSRRLPVHRPPSAHPAGGTGGGTKVGVPRVLLEGLPARHELAGGRHGEGPCLESSE